MGFTFFFEGWGGGVCYRYIVLIFCFFLFLNVSDGFCFVRAKLQVLGNDREAEESLETISQGMSNQEGQG